jgi:hypothetical protein
VLIQVNGNIGIVGLKVVVEICGKMEYICEETTSFCGWLLVGPSSMETSKTDLLERRAAAVYCGVTPAFLANLAKSRARGPAFTRVSPRKTLYLRSDLDRWIASWIHVEPTTAKE